MSSSDELTMRILSRLGLEKGEDDSSEGRSIDSPEETTSPLDPSPTFSILDNLDEDVQRLDSDVMTLDAKIEARAHEITELASCYQSLRFDRQRARGEVQWIKETVRCHGERLDEVDTKLETLYAFAPMTCENSGKIAKLEERTDDLAARLDDEKRQREESHSNLSGLLSVVGFLALLCLLNRQRLAVTQSAPRSTSPVRDRFIDAESAATAYMAALIR